MLFKRLFGKKQHTGKVDQNKIQHTELIQKLEYGTSLQIGQIVSFGHYYQSKDNDKPENIEWIVLDRSHNSYLLISKYALDSVCFHPHYTHWKDSYLRKWLNGVFLDHAFSTEEQSHIKGRILPDNGLGMDQVFLLSIDEAKRYFRSDQDRQCKPTWVALMNGSGEDKSGNCWWWLRSPARDIESTSYVWNDGSIQDNDVVNYCDPRGVRPAVWVDL